MAVVSPGFSRRREEDPSGRIPPGQFEVKDWPVLTYGPTPHTSLDDWDFKIEGLVENPLKFSWEEFINIPQTALTTDIHCVTHWTKLGMSWEGVSLDLLFEQAGVKPEAKFIVAYCDGGYTTNLPLGDVTGGRAMVALRADGRELAPEHGYPARLFVPHLYFWKSAKWVRGIKLVEQDQPGFWEQNGYHNHGDPWKEERYGG